MFIAPKSKDTEGQQFWLVATNPSTNSTVVAIALGSVLAPLYNWTWALGSSTPAPVNPLGLWYLKLRPTKWIPLASSADAKVSPS